MRRDFRATECVVAASLMLCAGAHGLAVAGMRRGDLYAGAGGGLIAPYQHYGESAMWSGRVQYVLAPALAVALEGGTSNLEPHFRAQRARLNMFNLEMRGFARSKHAFHPVAAVGIGLLQAPVQDKLSLGVHAALGFAIEIGPTMVCLQGSYHGATLVQGLPGQDQYIRVMGLFSTRVRRE